MKAFNPPDNVSYTFADYFKLSYEVDEVLAYFGYDFKRVHCQLPRSPVTLDRLPDLRFRLEENAQYTSFSNEMARREFLIAPVLTELIVYTHSRLRVEYALSVSDKLKGSLDYLLQGKRQLLVIEAKNADLEQGFKQLATELVALDRWQDEPLAKLYGAVSIGTLWQFGVLQRTDKQVIQDLDVYRVPADVEDLLRVMIAILQDEGE
jgi:hypothetical protein